MITLIIGGGASGKSEYAESYCLKIQNFRPLYYVATMKVYGKEGEQRVKKHRSLRAGKGFETIECDEFLSECSIKGGVVLLEDVSNLAANIFFNEANASKDANLLCDDIIYQIDDLSKRCDDMVIVSNNIFEDGCEYEELTKRYIKVMGLVNQKIAKRSDRVVEVVAGLEVVIK